MNNTLDTINSLPKHEGTFTDGITLFVVVWLAVVEIAFLVANFNPTQKTK